jgi:hypothetical protein
MRLSIQVNYLADLYERHGIAVHRRTGRDRESAVVLVAPSGPNYISRLVWESNRSERHYLLEYPMRIELIHDSFADYSVPISPEVPISMEKRDGIEPPKTSLHACPLAIRVPLHSSSYIG